MTTVGSKVRQEDPGKKKEKVSITSIVACLVLSAAPTCEHKLSSRDGSPSLDRALAWGRVLAGGPAPALVLDLALGLLRLKMGEEMVKFKAKKDSGNKKFFYMDQSDINWTQSSFPCVGLT